MNDEKNILILSDLNTHLESQLVESLNFNPNHVMSIQSFQAEIAHAYGDVMRSIIIAIYEYDIEHVYIIRKSDDKQVIALPESVKSHTEKIKTLDYLFENCKPEFSSDNIHEWLNGESDIHQSIKQSIHQVSNHPLIPSGITIKGMTINQNNIEIIAEYLT